MTENERVLRDIIIGGNGYDYDESIPQSIFEEIQAYRAIGTVEGYECAIESSLKHYNLMKEYKTKVQEFEAIGTIEEFKVLKEKSVAKKPITYTHTHRADCPNCRATVRGIDKPFGDYCSKCGTKIDWSE